MKKKLQIIILLISVSNLYAQLPGIMWQKCLGGSNYDVAVGAKEGPNGGYTIAGVTKSSDGDVTGYHGGYDGWIVRTDANGNILWNKTIGGTQDEFLSDVVFTADGGAVCTGYTKSVDGDMTGNPSTNPVHQMMFAVKVDGNGNIVWLKFYGPVSGGTASGIAQTSDGNYLVAGQAFLGDSVSGSFEAILTKLDANGNQLWQKIYGGAGIDNIFRIIETSDGNYAFSGSSATGDNNLLFSWGSTDVWVVKTDTSGNRLWQVNYGTSSNDVGYNILETSDGKLLIGAYTYGTDGQRTQSFGNYDAWILKLSSTGALEWEKSFGGLGSDQPRALYELEDGYVIGGQISYFTGNTLGILGGTDFWVFKIDFNGDLIWQTTYGGTKNDVLASFNTTSDRGYIMSGQTHSNDINVSGNHSPGINEYEVDGWLLKLAEGPLSSGENSFSRTIYPNPVSNILNIPFYENGYVKIYDLAGREVTQKTIENHMIDLTSLFPGTYFLKIDDGKTTYSHRFIKN